MAQTCIKCGKKIGVFSADPLTLCDERFLCYDCAGPIKNEMNDLYYAKNVDEFNLLKDKILNTCKSNYDSSITDDISRRITDIFYNHTNLCEKQKSEDKKKHIENYFLTTGFDFYGYTIKKYIGVVSGQVVLGTGFLSEFTASFADFFGEESNRFAEKLEKAKNAALEKMILTSDSKGGNAIIGVDFDYITFHGNMIGVVANGTSVVIEKNQD